MREDRINIRIYKEYKDVGGAKRFGVGQVVTRSGGQNHNWR